ncbi:MAG: ribbon-helix-helix domain-containing protein [archaeon]|nr:ribbon-helix-helix domain-containing protein [archaeon]
MKVSGEISEYENEKINELIREKKYLNKSDFVRHCIRKELEKIEQYKKDKERNKIILSKFAQENIFNK